MPLLVAQYAPTAISDRTLAIVLASGLVTLFVALAVLIWTRWGQARPLSKCIGLSGVAHLLLLVYAYSTRVLFDQPGHWTGQDSVKIHLADPRDSEEAAPLPEGTNPKPWEQPGIDHTAELNIASPSRPEATPAKPERADVKPREIPLETPAPAPLPMPAIAQIPPAIQPPPLLPDKPSEAAPPDIAAALPPLDGLPDELVTPLPDLPRRGALPKPKAADTRGGPGESPARSDAPCRGACAAGSRIVRFHAGHRAASAGRRQGVAGNAAGPDRRRPVESRPAVRRHSADGSGGGGGPRMAGRGAKRRWPLGCRPARGGARNPDARPRPPRGRAQADTGITGLALLGVSRLGRDAPRRQAPRERAARPGIPARQPGRQRQPGRRGRAVRRDVLATASRRWLSAKPTR